MEVSFTKREKTGGGVDLEVGMEDEDLIVRYFKFEIPKGHLSEDAK